MNQHQALIDIVSKFELFDSLGTLRAYFQFLQFRQQLPLSVQVPPDFYTLGKVDTGIHEWDLIVILKEVILHCKEIKSSANTLRDYNQLANTINCVLSCERELYEQNQELYKSDKMQGLFRVIQRQVPWQVSPNDIFITRYYKIYTYKPLQEIVQRKFGISVKEIYTIGMAFIGFFLDKFAIDENGETDIPGIDRNTQDRFLKNFSKNFDEIQALVKNHNSYDVNYLYHFNPLSQYPIIRTPFQGMDCLLVPVPSLLLRRFTDGLFYEICGEDGFAAAYGDAFQLYVGEILNKVNFNGNFQVIAEERYKFKKEDKRSADWMITDSSANLFIECKTKRLRAQAKFSFDDSILAEDLTKLADGVTQLYKTIIHYKVDAYSRFKNNGKQIYPVLVTIEDWMIFGPKIYNILDQKIQSNLSKLNIAADILNEMPYTVCSVDELEIAMHVINRHSIAEVMEGKKNKRLWTLHGFLSSEYPADFSDSGLLFPDDFNSLLVV